MVGIIETEHSLNGTGHHNGASPEDNGSREESLRGHVWAAHELLEQSRAATTAMVAELAIARAGAAGAEAAARELQAKHDLLLQREAELALLVETLQAEIAQLSGVVESSDFEMESERGAKETLKTQIEELEGWLQQAAVELDSQRAAAEEETARLSGELEASQQGLAQAAEWQQRAARLEEERDSLLRGREQTDREMAQLQQRIESLEAELAEAGKAASQQPNPEFETLQAELAEARADSERFADENERFETELEEANAIIADLRAIVTAFKVERKEATAAQEALITQRDDLLAQLKEARTASGAAEAGPQGKDEGKKTPEKNSKVDKLPPGGRILVEIATNPLLKKPSNDMTEVIRVIAGGTGVDANEVVRQVSAMSRGANPTIVISPDKRRVSLSAGACLTFGMPQPATRTHY